METIKANANINSSFLNKKILRFFNIKSLIFLCGIVLLGLIIMVVCFVFKQWIVGSILMVFFALIGITFAWNYGNFLNNFISLIKFLFLKKYQKTTNLNYHKNFVEKNKKWYGFYEIQSKSLINLEDKKIEQLINTFSNFFVNEINWSWLKLDLSFSTLKDQFNFLAVNKLNEWIAKKDGINLQDDIIARNIYSQARFTQEFITNSEENKNFTYILMLSADSVKEIKNAQEVLNKNCFNIDFYLKTISDEKMSEILDHYFYVNSDLKINSRIIETKAKVYNTPKNYAELYEMVVENNNTKEVIGEQTKYLSFIKIISLPIFAEAGFLANIFNRLDDVEVALHTYEIKEKKEGKILQRELENQKDYVNQSIHYAEFVKNQQNLEALDEMMQDAISSNARFQKYELILRISKTSKKEIIRARRHIQKLLKSWKFEYETATFNQFQLLKSFNRQLNFSVELKRFDANMLSNDRLAWGYPFVYGKNKNDASFLLGLDLENGQPIYRDFINMHPHYKNLHSIYAGPSGSGKTEAIKYKILNNISHQKTLSILIDPTGTLTSDLEKHHDIQSLKPQILSMNNNDNSLNPFEMSFLLNDETDTTEIQQKIEFMLLFFKEQVINFDDEMRTVLSEALTIFYLNYQNQNRKDYMDYFYEILENLFKNDVNYQNSKHKNNLLKMVNALTLKNGITKYWAKPSSLKIDEDANLVIVNIEPKASESKMQIVKNLMLLIWLKNYVYTNLEKPQNVRKHIEIICDEFSTFIQNNSIAILSGFNELYKMARKYDTAMTILLQNLTTFSTQKDNMYLNEIWSNTQFVFLFQLQQNEINAMSYLFGDSIQLNDKERETISNLNKGECVLIANNKKTWLSIQNLVSNWFIENNEAWNESIRDGLKGFGELYQEYKISSEA